jgi:hypothetical protein
MNDQSGFKEKFSLKQLFWRLLPMNGQNGFKENFSSKQLFWRLLPMNGQSGFKENFSPRRFIWRLLPMNVQSGFKENFSPRRFIWRLLPPVISCPKSKADGFSLDLAQRIVFRLRNIRPFFKFLYLFLNIISILRNKNINS